MPRIRMTRKIVEEFNVSESDYRELLDARRNEDHSTIFDFWYANEHGTDEDCITFSKVKGRIKQ